MRDCGFLPSVGVRDPHFDGGTFAGELPEEGKGLEIHPYCFISESASGPFAKKSLDPSTYRCGLSYALLKEQPGTLLEEYVSTLPMYTAGKGWILQDQI